MESAETKTYKGHNIIIEQDEYPINPRENDNICVFHIGHSQYAFGDENYTDRESIDEAYHKALDNGDVCLPLYMYDHSDITISLGKFSCPWDSGQVGFVQVPRLTMIKEFGNKLFTPKLKEKALEWAKMEVEEMDKHLRGESYGYIIDDDDSCWGYFSIEDAISEAEGIINWIVKDATKKHCKQIKAWIKYSVPFNKRYSLQKAMKIN